MEILTLLKANIRHKKGSFISIIILMIIVSMSFTSVISIQDNCSSCINDALDSVNAAELQLYLTSDALSDDLLSSVKNNPLVKDVISKEAVSTFGAKFGDTSYNNPWFMTRLTDEYRLLDDDKTGYTKAAPLEKGEIYIPQGLCTSMGCDIGDKLEVETIDGFHEFTVKGLVVEPVNGGMTMGLKIVFVSDDDYAALHRDAVAMSDAKRCSDFRLLQIYKADKSMSDSQFKNQLNRDTGIVDYANFSIQRAQSYNYTYISVDMILSGLLIFVGFLVAIVIIVLAHSISTGIEMEYTSLGMLKAQGFTSGKIKAVFALQYLVAQIIGSVIGTVLAVPVIMFFGDVFRPIIGIPSRNSVSAFKSILFIAGVLAVSALFIALASRKIGKISPMKAISGGKNDVYFSNRLNAPLSKKALTPSLAFRQFTSNKRRYIATIIIVSILMFFMITMNVMGASVTSKSAMENMGMPIAELNIDYKEDVPDSTVKDIESIIEKHTAIERKYNLKNMYMSLNGSEYMSIIYKNPESLMMSEGRYPKYDNEIALTQILADELDLKIGDKITVSNQGKKLECIVTGLYNHMFDLGLNFSIPFEAAQKLGVQDVLCCAYSLKEPSKCMAIADEIEEKYPDILTVSASETDSFVELYSTARNAMTGVIYAVSVLFSLVVVMMVCKKAFLQERRDIGIFKSLGFTSSKLRLQFAVRFLIVSLAGSALGIVISLFCTPMTLTWVFKMIGVSNFISRFSALSIIIPAAITAVSFFTFAYLSSRKIKKVEIKELVTE